MLSGRQLKTKQQHVTRNELITFHGSSWDTDILGIGVNRTGATGMLEDTRYAINHYRYYCRPLTGRNDILLLPHFFVVHELPQSDGKCQFEVKWQARRDISASLKD